MPSYRRLLVSACAVGVALAMASACGSSSGGITEIRGSSETISKAMLDHWIRAVVATDYRVSVGAKAPRGLAEEPANYSECAAAARKIIPRSSTGQPRLTNAEVSEKCHELYLAVRNQAMSYVLSAQWTKLEAKEQGITLTPAELHKEFLRYRRESWETPAKFQLYMRERQLVLSDVIYQLTRNILVTRALPRFEAKVKRAGGGERVYARLALQRYRGLIAKTTCKTGYVMEDCNTYHQPAKQPISPNVVLEGFVAAVPHT